MSNSPSPHHVSGVLADILRAAVLVSIVAAVLWYPPEAVVRFALLFLLVLVPRIAAMPRPFDAAFVATLLLATWSGVAGWYSAVSWLDLAVHCVATGATGAMLYLAFARIDIVSDLHDPPLRGHHSGIVVLTLAFGSSAAVLWEFYEWLGNEYLTATIHVGYDDTIGDLAMGATGSLVAGLTLVAWAAAGWGTRRASASAPSGRD